MPNSSHNPATGSVVVMSDQLWFSCPSCKGELKVPIAMADSTGACPLCGGKVHIPATCQKAGSSTPVKVAAEDDPEMDAPIRTAFSADLNFIADPETAAPKRGFFDPEPEPTAVIAEPPPKQTASVALPKPVLSALEEPPKAKTLSVPIRKFTAAVPLPREESPVAPIQPELPPKQTAPVALPKPVVEEKPRAQTQSVPLKKEEHPALLPTITPDPPALLERKANGLQAVPPLEVSEALAKPLRKFPTKPRRPRIIVEEPVAEELVPSLPEEPAAPEVVEVALPVAAEPAAPQAEAIPAVEEEQPVIVGFEPDVEPVQRAESPHETYVFVPKPQWRMPDFAKLHPWLRVAAVAVVAALPLIFMTWLCLVQVPRLATWIRGLKHEDKQASVSPPKIKPLPAGAATELRQQAVQAIRHEWSRATAVASKPSAHPVAFRAGRIEGAMPNPEEDWPQLLLRNYGTFIGHSPMDGASSFIIESANGDHWVATSAELLGSAGGVEPPLEPGKLTNALHRWRAYLPNKPEMFAEVVGGRQLVSVVTADWLVMRLSSKNAVVPVKPLRLRHTPLKKDETVYLVGLPYDDRTAASQHVYAGQIVPSNQVDAGHFAFVVEANVDFSGFRGAPILDADCEVVGVLTDRWSTMLIGTRSELLTQLLGEK